MLIGRERAKQWESEEYSVEIRLKYKWERLNAGRKRIHLTALDTMDTEIYQKKRGKENGSGVGCLDYPNCSNGDWSGRCVF